MKPMRTFAAIDGMTLPGGCNQCDAIQELNVTDYGALISISHDDWCPTWRAIQAGRDL